MDNDLLLAEADRVGIIDHEWYKRYLRNRLEDIGFEHFSKASTVTREKIHEIVESTHEKYKEVFDSYDPVPIKEKIDNEKKDEAVDPTIDEYGEVFCGNCGKSVGIVGQITKMVVRMRYCPECGKAVNWKAVKLYG